MTVHRYQDCELVTVDRDAQGIEVMGYDEAGGTSSIYCCTLTPAASGGFGEVLNPQAMSASELYRAGFTTSGSRNSRR